MRGIWGMDYWGSAIHSSTRSSFKVRACQGSAQSHISLSFIMAAPTASFLGGIGLTIPVQMLLTFNGSVFGISGFYHNAIRGKTDALFPLAGLFFGGIVTGILEQHGPETLGISLWRVIVSVSLLHVLLYILF